MNSFSSLRLGAFGPLRFNVNGTSPAKGGVVLTEILARSEDLRRLLYGGNGEMQIDSFLLRYRCSLLFNSESVPDSAMSAQIHRH